MSVFFGESVTKKFGTATSTTMIPFKSVCDKRIGLCYQKDSFDAAN